MRWNRREKEIGEMNKMKYERERNRRNRELPMIFIFPIEKEIKWNLEEKKKQW